MRARTILSIGVFAVASLGAATLYVHGSGPPTCDSDRAIARVYAVLRDQFHMDSMFVNNIETVSGGFFSDQHECSAEVTQIRSHVNASDMPWRAIRYWIAPTDRSGQATVTVELNGAIPLAGPPPSLWHRLAAYM